VKPPNSFHLARGALAVLCGAAASLAAIIVPGDESRPPAAPVPQSRPMSGDYRVLLSRSVFSRDHNRPRLAARDVATTQAVSAIPDLTGPAAAEAEANFVLKGVAIEDGLPTAFFEQSLDQQTVRVRAGQAVSHGQISAITLDGINYLAAGKLSHVVIGQTLDGGLATTTTATTQPSTASATPAAEHPAGEKPSWWRKRKP
jgi:hypothetical protein